MPIENSSVLVDGTIAVTAGINTALLTLGTNENEKTLVLDDDSEFLSSTRISFSTKRPKKSVSAPNGYTQERNTVKLLVPRVLTNGNNTMDSVTVTVSSDVETSDVAVQSMIVLATQLLSNSAYADFWKKQSLG